MYDHIDHKVLFRYYYQNVSIDKFSFTCNKKRHDFQKSKHAKHDLIRRLRKVIYFNKDIIYFGEIHS